MSAPEPPTRHADAAEALDAAYRMLVEIARRRRSGVEPPPTQPTDERGADEADATAA